MSAVSTTIAATTIPPRTGTKGAVTSFVPLTTTFTPNSVCSNVFVKFGPNGHGLMGYDPAYGSIDPLYDCNPSVVSEWFTQSKKGPITPGETGISMGPFICSNFGTFTTTLTGSSTVGAIAITGWNVNYVRSVAPSTSMNNNMSNATGTSSIGDSSGSTLSGGTIAGIVIGVVAGLALLIGSLFIFMRKRRKAHQPRAFEADSAQAGQAQRAELHSQQIAHELDQANIVTELPTDNDRPFELEGEEKEK
ncbi:hypothetical protein N7467_000999 [Penicillium canescens]|nr:hypothetical protein N7467_000999 [Penicillium canescens]